MSKTRSEKTSSRVARIAAKVLTCKARQSPTFPRCVTVRFSEDESEVLMPRAMWRNVRALAASCLTQAPDKTEVARLRKRLEMTHVYQMVDGKMVKRGVARGHYLSGGPIYDAIDCRDETIRQQDRYIKELLGRLAALQPKAKGTQAFKASGNYVPPPVLRNVEVTVIGGGPARIKSVRNGRWPKQRVLKRGP